jgi:hypothetical protein
MRTIRLNRNKIYLIGVVTILLFVIINRINFIIGSKFTIGQVIKTKSWSTRNWRGGSSYYTAPVVKFNDQHYEITFQGEGNEDLKPGEFVKVIYKSDDQSNAKIFNFIDFVLPPLLYSLIPFLLLSAATFSFIESTDFVEINLEKLYKLTIRKEKSSRQSKK